MIFSYFVEFLVDILCFLKIMHVVISFAKRLFIKIGGCLNRVDLAFLMSSKAQLIIMNNICLEDVLVTRIYLLGRILFSVNENDM